MDWPEQWTLQIGMQRIAGREPPVKPVGKEATLLKFGASAGPKKQSERTKEAEHTHVVHEDSHQDVYTMC